MGGLLWRHTLGSAGECRGGWEERDESRRELPRASIREIVSPSGNGHAATAGSPLGCPTKGCDRAPLRGSSLWGICAENKTVGLRVIDSALLVRRATTAGQRKAPRAF